VPLTVPNLDTRKYQDILDEAIARIPVHTPEWTNFNKSDPGVTILEIFAFLSENLNFVANQIPEKNRLKFLTLLGVPLQPATPAIGLATFSNDRGPLASIPLPAQLEVWAGNVPFQTIMGLGLLPVGALIFTKQTTTLTDAQTAYYAQLYASYANGPLPPSLQPYEPVQFTGQTPVDLSTTVDAALWIALVARKGDPVDVARTAIGNGIVSIGFVPVVDQAAGRDLQPVASPTSNAAVPLTFSTPVPNSNPPAYQACAANFGANVLAQPGVVQVTLPSAANLTLWDNLGPLDAGAGDYPPALNDTDIEDQIITWLRVSAPTQAPVQLMWVGINTTTITQRAHISGELLPTGTGEPDQSVTLANPSSLAGSVALNITTGDTTETWTAIDDIASAPPEVVVQDLRLAPGTVAPPPGSPNVFMVDNESGVITFGDGAHGRRPPFGAVIRADYDYGLGDQGNVGVGAVNSAPALPAGLSVTNPVHTWGGVDAQTAGDGEKQIPSYLQHRDRLVTSEDFQNVTLRTPGVAIARVEVLPVYNPNQGAVPPGGAPGCVTVMVIPWVDAVNPDTPDPTSDFINAICNYLDPRRLVTTEIIVIGPQYVGVWISIGLEVLSGYSEADVIAAVQTSVTQALSSLPPDPTADPATLTPRPVDAAQGWELGKDVVDREILAYANRVTGVLLVNSVILTSSDQTQTGTVTMNGLQLPRVLGIGVAVGDPTPIAALIQGQVSAPPPNGATRLPVPVAPDEC
jgi:hypothetical protein